MKNGLGADSSSRCLSRTAMLPRVFAMMPIRWSRERTRAADSREVPTISARSLLVNGNSLPIREESMQSTFRILVSTL